MTSENNSRSDTRLSAFNVKVKNGHRVEFDDGSQQKQSTQPDGTPTLKRDFVLAERINQLGGLVLDPLEFGDKIFRAYGRGSERNGVLENTALKALSNSCSGVMHLIRKIAGGDEIKNSVFTVICEPEHATSIETLLQQSDSVETVHRKDMTKFQVSDFTHVHS